METATNRADGARMTVTPVLSRRASSRGSRQDIHSSSSSVHNPRITRAPFVAVSSCVLLESKYPRVLPYSYFVRATPRLGHFSNTFFVDPI